MNYRRAPKIFRPFDSFEINEVRVAAEKKDPNRWMPSWPFIALNLSVLTVFLVGWSPVAVGVAVALYLLRMHGITGWYHRYFSHRTFKTSRWMQFLGAYLGSSAAQRGPLWWAAQHRHHHRFSDMPEDIHSPKQGGFWNSHMLWWGRRRNMPTPLGSIQDFAKFPELVFLDRFDGFAPFTLGVACFLLGVGLEYFAPGLGTNGWQMLVWGFVISTVVLFHGVATINSLAHVFGSRRFKTTDTSRNNFLLAIITLGEGWHNNHHHYQNSVKQGFYWWEIDVSYYIIRGLAALGLTWDLKGVPERILNPDLVKVNTTPVGGIPKTLVPAVSLASTSHKKPLRVPGAGVAIPGTPTLARSPRNPE
jgi:stearoyl-CoA desaturase (delta-9 desaturase)